MYSVRNFVLGAMAAVAVSAAAAGSASAQGQLNIYCSVQVEWCQGIATNFQRETGINVNMSLKGSGEALAQLIAEKRRTRDATSGSAAPAIRICRRPRAT